MPDHTGKLPPKRPAHRWLFLLAILTLALFGWWWSRRSTMRLVARIIIPSRLEIAGTYAPVLIGAGSGVLLGVVTSNAAVKPLNTFMFLGWDGRTCWQVSLPAGNMVLVGYGPFSSEVDDQTIALSPDGHLFALAETKNHRREILTWRDGHLLGVANPPALGRAGMESYQLQVANSGRVWLSGTELPPCRIWAVDGARVTCGKYQPSFTVDKRRSFCESSFSPDDGKLICSRFPLHLNKPDASDDVAVQMKDGKMLFTRRATAGSHIERIYLGQAVDKKYPVDCYTDTTVDNDAGEHPGTKEGCNVFPGWYSLEPNNAFKWAQSLRVYLPPPDHPWLVPHTMAFTGCACQAGGHTVLLVVNDTHLSSLLSSVHKLPLSSPQTPFPSTQWLTIYTAPGKMRAIQRLPRDARIHAFQLSPDGHRIAVLLTYPDARKELLFYRW